MRRKRWVWLPLWILAASSSNLAAQTTADVSRLQLGLQITEWLFPGSSRWGATALFSLQPGVRFSRVMLEAAVSYLPGNVTPEGRGAQLGISVAALPRSRTTALNAMLSLGYSGSYFDARAHEAASAACTAAVTCMFEGMSYRTGWQGAWVLGAAFDLPVTTAVAIRLAPDLVLQHPAGAGPQTEGYFRLSLGATWRH